MANISAIPGILQPNQAFREYLKQDCTTLATFARVTRRDGHRYYLTDHDQDTTIFGNRYLASSGFQRTAVEINSDLNNDNLEVSGFTNVGITALATTIAESSAETNISVEVVRANLLDFAGIWIWIANYLDPEMGCLILKRGILKDVSLTQNRWKSKVLGMKAQIATGFAGQNLSKECRADLGDRRCRFALESMKSTRTIAEDQLSRDEIPFVHRSFNGGKMIWRTGANAGISHMVSYVDGTKAKIWPRAPFPIRAGDTSDFYPGCQKRWKEDCRDTFGNIENFRGEPMIPGRDYRNTQIIPQI